MNNFNREEPEIPDEIASAVNHRKLPRPNAQQGRTYTEEQKTLALAVYAECGNIQTAAEETGIPRTTVRSWIERDPEIDAKLDELRQAIRHRTAHRYAEIAVRATDALLDRVTNGDIHVDKEGVMTRRPIPGRELAWIASMATDKHALLTATSVRQRAEDSSLQKLADGLLAVMDKRARTVFAVDAVQHDEGANSVD